MSNCEIYDYDFTIPSILLDLDCVTKTDLRVYRLVKSSARKKGYCFATNEWLGEHLGMVPRVVQKYLSRLKRLGLIDCEIHRCGVQTSRKIFMLDDSRKRHEIYRIQKQNKHDPNRSPGGDPNGSGGGDPNRSHVLEEDTTKTKIQQQAAAVSSDEKPKATAPPPTKLLYPCLKDLAIPVDEKAWLMEHHSEPVVAKAVAWATHPTTQIKTTLPQAIKWACTSKPEIPVSSEDLTAKHKLIAQQIAAEAVAPTEGIHNFPTASFDLLSKGVEITRAGGASVTVIPYDDKNFVEKVIEALKKYGFRGKDRTKPTDPPG
jgi:hypothetical protein